MRERVSWLSGPLLVATVTSVALSFGVNLAFHTESARYVAVVLLIVSAITLGLTFIARAVGLPKGGEMYRWTGAGAVGILGALVIWLRDFEHLGPRGNWLWAILLVMLLTMAVLLVKDLRRGT